MYKRQLQLLKSIRDLILMVLLAMIQKNLIISLALTLDIGHLVQILDGIFLMEVQHKLQLRFRMRKLKKLV